MPQANEWRIPPPILHRKILAFDPSAALPWHITDAQIDKLIWPLVKGNEIIGLCDTGISEEHFKRGELQGQVLHGQDFTNSGGGPWDHHDHGSFCAGLMVAKSFGIAKNCAKIVSAKVLGDDGSGTDQSIAAGIRWCVEQGATIISLSLGSSSPSPLINAAVDFAISRGCWCVFAAGNSSGQVEFPARDYGGISAVTRERTLAVFSCFGAPVYACEYGVEISSLNKDLGGMTMSGTSMSTPMSAAWMAVKRAYDVMQGKTPPKTKAEWIAWLTEDSDDLGTPGRDAQFGVGIVNASKFAKVPLPPVVVPPVSPPTPSMPPPAAGSVAMAMSPDGKNWWRVPAGTKLEPLKVA